MNSLESTAALFIFVLFSLTVGCEKKQDLPENVLGEETYIDLMVELQLVETYRMVDDKDSVNVDSLKQIIFEKYNTSEEQFRITHEYYQEDVDKQKERITKAIEQLRVEISELKGEEGTDTLNRRRPGKPNF